MAAILMTDQNVERLVCLLALAGCVTSTEEHLRYFYRSRALKRAHPELQAIHEDDLRVQARLAEYLAEGAGQ